MKTETALLVGGPSDGARVKVYEGQRTVCVVPCSAYNPGANPMRTEPLVVYHLHVVAQPDGWHALVGVPATETRGPLRALVESYRGAMGDLPSTTS